MQFNQLYGFVRGRQLDGTFPGDKSTGVWPITTYRVLHGWGSPPESAWPYENSIGVWPPPEPEGLDDLASAGRIGGYRRIRTLDSCESALSTGVPVQVSLDITAEWADPPGGIIRPSDPEALWLGAHSVVLESFDATTQRFRFWNNWGPDWGDAGYGYICRDALAEIWHEAWTFFPPPITHPRSFPDHMLNTWMSQSPSGEKWHWLQQKNLDGEVIGWTSMIETDETCELEELFVRPRFRGRGFGRKLLDTMAAMAAKNTKLFLAWIPYPDAGEDHLQMLEMIFQRRGLTIHLTEERWAPYVAAPRAGLDARRNRDTSELRVSAEALSVVTDIRLVEVGKMVVEACNRGSTSVTDLILTIERRLEPLRAAVDDLRKSVNVPIDGALNQRLNRDRNFAQGLANVIQQSSISEDVEIEDTPDEDDDDEDENATGAMLGVTAYRAALRALARSQTGGRRIRLGTRNAVVLGTC